MEATVGLAVDRFDLVTLAPSIKQPTLLFHDDTDQEVPASESRALNEVFPHSHMIETSGYGHSRLLHDPDVIREIVEFLHAPIRP